MATRRIRKIGLIIDTNEQRDRPGERRRLWPAPRPNWIALGCTATRGPA